MIDFALANKRLVGMIQKQKNNKLYKIGCYGKIYSFDETDDGRYFISLVGVSYFKLLKEIKNSNKFKLASISIINHPKESTNGEIFNFDRNVLINKYSLYCQKLKLSTDFNLLDKISDEDLIKFISMSCPFSVEDKQMLLEACNISELSNKLLTLLDFYNNADKVINIIN